MVDLMGVTPKDPPPTYYQVLGKSKDLFPLKKYELETVGRPLIDRLVEERANLLNIPRNWLESRLTLYISHIGYKGYLNNIFLERLESILDDWVKWELSSETWRQEELRQLNGHIRGNSPI
jgi:hypothetical protein